MTGDKYTNNCCILDFPDGSQASVMCGFMSTVCLWKEYMEIFSAYTAITVSEFTDMRVRGFEGEFDRVYAPHMAEHAEEVLKYGFDFYETYRAELQYRLNCDLFRSWGMGMEHVRRPCPQTFDVSEYDHVNPDLYDFLPDKGWISSLEHFAKCCLDGSTPQNANGKAGALSTAVALALLESLETGRSIDM